MANEKRLDLIDRNELLPNKVFYVCNENPVASLDELLNRIANAKTVDAVEVVRCKDCHWWTKINRLNGSGLCRHEVFSVYDCTQDPQTDPDDFCSYGERNT